MTWSRLHISVFLALAFAAWAVASWVKGVPMGWGHVGPFGTVVGFLVGVGIVFEHFLWRQRWLYGWFVKRPDLRGTWRGEIKSDWVDPATGESVPVIRCYLGVTQTLSKLQLHLMTPESESWLVAERVHPSPNGNGYQVFGVYTNKPHVHLRGERSEIHYGAIILDTHGPSPHPNIMTGEYWTDRKTSGSLTFSGRTRKDHTRFEDAEMHYEGVKTQAVATKAGVA
jgi:hypothetical protein